MTSLRTVFTPKNFLILLVVVLVAAVGWLYYDRYLGDGKQANKAIDSFAACVAAGNPIMESYPEQCAANGKTFTNPDQKLGDDMPTGDGWGESITSGKGVFSVKFPNTWTNISRDTSDDIFMVRGAQQPNSGNTSSVGAVQDVPSTAGEGPVVLAVWTGSNFAEPLGNSTNFTLQNGKENPIVGKKFTYVFPTDEAVSDEGLGASSESARKAGDRQYEYVFQLKDGKELRVLYNVYAADPRNSIETVEALIQTIRILK